MQMSWGHDGDLLGAGAVSGPGRPFRGVQRQGPHAGWGRARAGRAAGAGTGSRADHTHHHLLHQRHLHSRRWYAKEPKHQPPRLLMDCEVVGSGIILAEEAVTLAFICASLTRWCALRLEVHLPHRTCWQPLNSVACALGTEGITVREQAHHIFWCPRCCACSCILDSLVPEMQAM